MARTLGQRPVGASDVASDSFTPDEILAQRDVVRELGYYFDDDEFYRGMFAKMKINGGEKMVHTHKQSHYMQRSIFGTATVATSVVSGTEVVITYTAASVTGVLPDPTSYGNVGDVITTALSPIRGRIRVKSSTGVTTTITVSPFTDVTAAALDAVFAPGTEFGFFTSTTHEGASFRDGQFNLFDRIDINFTQVEEATARMTNEFLGSGWKILVNGSEYPLKKEMLDVMRLMEIKCGMQVIYGKGVGFGDFGTTGADPETMGLHTIGLTYGGVVSTGGSVDATDERNINNYADANQMGSRLEFNLAIEAASDFQDYIQTYNTNWQLQTPIDQVGREVNLMTGSYTSKLNKRWDFFALPEAGNVNITNMGQSASGWYANTGIVTPYQGTGKLMADGGVGTYGQENTQPLDYEIMVFGQPESLRGAETFSKLATAYQEPEHLDAWKRKFIVKKDFGFRCRAINKVIAITI